MPTGVSATVEPRSVAVVGAGRTRGVGAAIFHNLAGSFRGPVYPVNPHARRIGALNTYASVADVPGPVDLAVIAVPAATVDAVIDDCIRKQVGAVIVISAGFGETGEEGRAHEAAIRDKVRRAGLRMVGPNCLGLVNTDPAFLLNASFSPAFPPAGTVAFSSQSGALGLAILEELFEVAALLSHCYAFPESGICALAHAVAYGRWRSVPAESPATLHGIDHAAAGRIVREALSAGGGWMTPLATSALLAAAGIAAAPTEVVATPEGALASAQRVGLPVVLKGVGPTLLHKTEAHAVFSDLDDEAAILRAFRVLNSRTDVKQIVVQPMVRDGIEMFVGALMDATFGPVVMCGRVGTHIELLRDAAQRLAPMTTRAAREMLDAIRGVALLRGFRGAPILDESALRDIVLRVSALVEACPQIMELDLNPVIVTQAGACVVDARVKVG
jgi:acyl-CoA synthetase (NDP forming)